MTEIVEIDGSLLEGGGQILRVAVTLSALQKVPVRVKNIRAGRKKGGLMEQHLKGIELVKDMCKANVKGLEFGSTEIEFYPNDIEGGSYTAHVNTAGSISLLLQIALPCALFAKSSVTLNLKGGTNAEMAPQIDYMTEVFKPILEKFGATFEFDLIKRGYYPKGGGEVVVTVNPVEKLNPVDITDLGNVTDIYGWSFTAGTLPIAMSHRMANSATSMLKQFKSVQIDRYKEDKNVASDNCAGIVLVAETDTKCIMGSSALGNRDESSEDTGKRAALELLKPIEEGACFDEHSQDQIIILLALAKGPSKVKVGSITMHTKTAIYIVEQLTKVTFKIVQVGSNNIIECSGS